MEVNQAVAKGQPLAGLDPAPFENAVAQAEAQLAAARASVAQAKVTEQAARLDAERTGRLLERGAATAVDLEDARVAFSGSGRHRLRGGAGRAAEGGAHRGRGDLADTVITSPIDGVVTVRLVDPGQTVVSAMSATALFTVASDLTDLKAEVGVDEADVAKVVADQPARFTVSAWPDRTFTGRVATVDLAPDDEDDVVTYDAELRGRERRPRAATRAHRHGRDRGRQVDDVLMIPPALRAEPMASMRTAGDVEAEDVWVVDGDAPRGRRHGPRTDGLATAIRADGLDAGMRSSWAGGGREPPSCPFAGSPECTGRRRRGPRAAGVDLDVARGEFVAIMGPSGSGKSDAAEHHRMPRHRRPPARTASAGVEVTGSTRRAARAPPPGVASASSSRASTSSRGRRRSRTSSSRSSTAGSARRAASRAPPTL